MSDDLVKRIKDRGDWLVDAVATATQNRQFLRGEPECDDVACDAIRMNGEKAMEMVAKPLADRIEELGSENENLKANLTHLRQTCQRAWDKCDEERVKLAMAVEAIKQLFALLDITEQTDDGRYFRPNVIHSSRALDAEKLEQVLCKLKKWV